MIINNTFRIEQAVLGNFATGGVIGTAATTVDIVGNLGIAQTTAGQTLSLPNPTITRPGLQTIVANTGTAAFTIYGAVVQPGQQTVIGYQGVTNGWTVQAASSAITDPNWLTATPYAVGAMVNYAGQNLICTVAHTSTTVAADAAKWSFFGVNSILAFTTGVYYFAGAIATVGGDLLIRATVSHTAGATYQGETANWTELGATSAATAWAAATNYDTGRLATINGQLLQRIASGVSAATFTLAESAAWRFVAPTSIVAWVTGVVYYPGATVTNGGFMYERTGATAVSLGTFLLDTANWTQVGGGASYVPAWPVSTAVIVDELRRYTVGLTTFTIRSNSARTTGATFTAAEAANWSLVAQDRPALWATGVVFLTGADVVRPGSGEYVYTATVLTGATFDADVASVSRADDNLAPTVLGNQATSGTITTADTAQVIEIAQTTAAVTTTLAIPTAGASSTVQKRFYWIRNSGTVSTTIVASAVTAIVLPGTIKQIYFNGTAFVDFGSSAFVAPLAWAAATFYSAGQQAISPTGALIERLAAGTSVATFNGVEGPLWQFVGNVGVVASYAVGSNTYVYAGQTIYDNANALIRAVSSHVMAATFTQAEQSAWAMVVNGNFAAWTATTFYYGNNRAVVNGQLIESQSGAPGHTSAATFTVGEAALWSFLGMQSTQAWATGVYYYVGAQATFGGTEYQRSVAGLSAATFPADASNWTAIADLSAASAWEMVTQIAHGFTVKQAVYWTGTAWALAIASSATTPALGIVTSVIDANTFVVTFSGKVTVTGHGLTLNNYYWLDQATAGLANITQPVSGYVQELLFVRDANTLQITVGQMFSVALSAATGSTYGDAKSGFQAADHAGWVLLDGRLKSALTATQQSQATALGFGVNIPNVPVGGVLVKGTLGAAVGSSTITQANLPNINLSGGSHSHTASDSGHSHVTNINNSTFNGSANGGERYLNNGGSTLNGNITSGFGSTSASANITVAASGALSIPLGGSGTAYIPAGVGVNQFVFLGA